MTIFTMADDAELTAKAFFSYVNLHRPTENGIKSRNQDEPRARR